MPTCLSRTVNCSLSYRLIILFLLFPTCFFGQTLTGLWTGALSNDSTTVRKDQSFEIALTEYRGKVYGYSRSEFIVDDTLYYVMKRVKGVIDGDVCAVVDDEIISYNFRGKLDKGIKVTSTFRRNQQDSTWYLAGTWKTNATKKYYSVTGRVDLSEEKDLATSKIFPHLEELNLANEVAFYKERIERPSIARVVKPEKIKTEYSTATITLPDNKNLAVAKPDWQRAEVKAVPEETTITKDNIAAINASKTEAKNIPATSVSISPAKPTSMDEYSVITNDNIAAINISKTEAKNIPANTVKVSPSKPTGMDDYSVINSDNIKGANASKTEVKSIDVSNVKVSPSKPVGMDEYHVINNDKIEKVETSRTTNNNIPGNKVSVSPVKPAIASTNKSVEETTPELNDDGTIRTQTASKNRPVVKDNTVPGSTGVTNGEVKNDVTKNITKNNAPAIVPENKKPAIDITAQHAMVAGRKTEFSQIVNFKADSIELSLYDNGEIDGDTVSIYYNGEVILSRQGLKAAAIKKTIHIPPGQNDFTLVLFAENLGKYPPNTGLLVVHDGNDVYNLRFSSDFQKNAGIVFRRNR